MCSISLVHLFGEMRAKGSSRWSLSRKCCNFSLCRSMVVKQGVETPQTLWTFKSGGLSGGPILWTETPTLVKDISIVQYETFCRYVYRSWSGCYFPDSKNNCQQEQQITVTDCPQSSRLCHSWSLSVGHLQDCFADTQCQAWISSAKFCNGWRMLTSYCHDRWRGSIQQISNVESIIHQFLNFYLLAFVGWIFLPRLFILDAQ